MGFQYKILGVLIALNAEGCHFGGKHSCIDFGHQLSIYAAVD